VAIEEPRTKIRRSLEEKLGVEEATYLMDRPPGGWSDLVTRSVLDDKVDVLTARLAAAEQSVLREIERRFRIQTWSLVVGLGAVAGILKV
jgi:hypothetical protein